MTTRSLSFPHNFSIRKKRATMHPPFEILKAHYRGLKRFLNENPQVASKANATEGIDLQGVATYQLTELTEDISEEVVKRENPLPTPFPASSRQDYSQERNMTRERLGTVSDLELCVFCLGVTRELERRHPELGTGADTSYPFDLLFPSEARSSIFAPPPAYTAVDSIPPSPEPAPPAQLGGDSDISSMAQTLGQHVVTHGRADAPSSSTREKLRRLTEPQFRELLEDTYDELRRREMTPQVLSLAPQLDMLQLRNKAREKLSRLPPPRFRNLVGDVYDELIRRHPDLQS